ncbi:hypothetical protein [Schlesneria paludicola]|uniref:hypothetical protein n=1 Tax=Schlesneria paludicola TaxID=360056 RepID=UPI00029A74FF|nr:hypothetical protein [Schlesneria paludicola]
MKILFSFAMCLGMFAGRFGHPCVHADDPTIPRNPQPQTQGEPQRPATEKSVSGKDRHKKEAKTQAKEMPPLDLGAIFQPLRALFGNAHPAVAVPAPAAVPIANAGDVEIQLKAIQEQYFQQLIPTRNAELAFVRLMCGELTPEQRRRIKSEADVALKAAARKFAEQQQQQQQRGQGGRVNSIAEPQSQIRVAISRVLKESLTEEQWTRFAAEASARNAIRKRAAIQSVVSRLDDQLLLTHEQREKITQSLTANWQSEWEKWIMMSLMYGNRFFPLIPDHYITPHLTTEQKSVWQGIQKVNPGWRMVQGQENFDDEWWNSPPAQDDSPADGQPGNLRFRATEIFR